MYEVDQYTVSLLHFDDGLKDECGVIWEPSNGATVTSSKKEFGASSLLLNGNKQFIQTNNNFNIGADDFTIDFWMLINDFNGSTTTDGQGICSWVTTPNYIGTAIALNKKDKSIYLAGGNAPTFKSPKVLQTNLMYHIAFVRHLGKCAIAINGEFSDWSTLDSITSINNLVLGRFYTNYDDYYSNVCIDEFRISNIARWTSDFDPNPQVGKALLVVTMSDQIQKEYELSKAQIDDFITWYDNRSTGTGLPHYTFNKDFNLGPFQSRKDYLVFDKIQNFEVMEYAK
ncbi:LamG-like jellyroll fold domain-containing protein [Pelosinus sp. IPA-1]|uniref:LamG-like jellyroll fold domain-containing protein n=1 Tax=Pelosinus sp. IPA-1 TaxID=3029569 RepID=UPI0024361901|nr:LamG-like jellyroll fold domain-containing protein [Pelosinus sp. IPA-1]GMB02266.1 hypothetical protein PIPA1_50670 [Pelosinus sp. IPA-1]